MLTKLAANSVAIKSFQSLTVNDGLLIKVVEAVKMGEKDARTSGDIKSFEVFYSGFRQNIAIGRIFIIPVKVCNHKETFPVALLYGTIIREFNLGEEMADLVTKKIGDTEFDSEYSIADFQHLKDGLFYDEEAQEYKSLILFAPHWSNIREYVAFKFVSDDDKLSNLLRHLVFAAYYNPAVSSAFDALMTNVSTDKLDVTDITPKLTHPFLTENPLRAFPELVKQGGWKKEKIFLTAKTADAIEQSVLEPAELNVFEALDAALTEVTLPSVEEMEDVADFKGPDGSNHDNAEIPEIGEIKQSIENTKEEKTAEEMDGTEKKKRCKYCGAFLINGKCPVSAKDCGRGKKASAPFEVPFTNVGPGTEAHDKAEKAIAVKVDTLSTKGEAPIGIELDDTGLPKRALDRKANFKAKKSSDLAQHALMLLDQFFESEDLALIEEVATLLAHSGEFPEALRELQEGLTDDDFEWSLDSFEKARSIIMGATSTPNHADAAHIARSLSKELTREHDASSTSTRLARKKTEDRLKKYESRKKADVELTEESIWADITEDFGPAPVVELPGDGSKSNHKSESSEPKSESSETPNKGKDRLDKMHKRRGEDDNGKPVGGKNVEPEEPKKDFKSKMFNKDKDASSKTAMMFMNDYDIQNAMRRYANDPVLGPVTKFLDEFKEQVNENSDGWAYWSAPLHAAEQLMTLIQKGSATPEEVKKAMVPIKSFMTRRGIPAGMVMPTLKLRKSAGADRCPMCGENRQHASGTPHKCNPLATPSFTPKKANGVEGDVSEAKSKVENPDTLDHDIHQPTVSVEEAAKIATALFDCRCGRKLVTKSDKDQIYSCSGCMLPNNICKCAPVDPKVAANSNDIEGNINNGAFVQRNPKYKDENVYRVSRMNHEGTQCWIGDVDDRGWFSLPGTLVKVTDPALIEQFFPGEASKVASDVNSDISEAKSKVVNPDTVDSDIHQPTVSVEEAAKVAADPRPEASDDACPNCGNDSVVWDNGLNDFICQHCGWVGEDEHAITNPWEPVHSAAAGDAHDESVEMALGFGDLADLATNLPHQDEHKD